MNTQPENTIKLRFHAPPYRHEELITALSEAGCYAFEEQDSALDAFIGESSFDKTAVQAAVLEWLPDFTGGFEVVVIPPNDWNAEWEKNFQPVHVGTFCEIHPTFKTSTPGFAHTIVIEPKMSFGTGHHETTWMMVDGCQSIDFRGKRVLDMGSGTGILGILALKLGAAEVDAIDFDPWCFENAQENAHLNQVRLNVILGDSSAIPEGRRYDIVLANINRNVLLADKEKYASCLAPGGVILLSGFFDFDAPMLQAAYSEVGLTPLGMKERNAWRLLSFRKEVNPTA